MYICARFSSGEMTNMKEAFFKLHLSVLLAGATGIFGRLISLNEGLLVWYRMLLAGLLFALLSAVRRRFPRIGWKEVFKIGGIGILLGLHWVFFYGSIKASNISIGVVCFSLVSFFTAFLEPWINRHRISVKEVLFSLLTLLGIALIFHLDTRYRQGILLGITSSVLAALFTITNKKVAAGHDASTMLLYEMSGGFVGLSCLLPFYLRYFPVETIFPDVSGLIYLILLASVCTIGLYLLQIQVLKVVSAFTVNLTYNLEPVYSIILAMLFFHEARELGLFTSVWASLSCRYYYKLLPYSCPGRTKPFLLNHFSRYSAIKRETAYCSSSSSGTCKKRCIAGEKRSTSIS